MSLPQKSYEELEMQNRWLWQERNWILRLLSNSSLSSSQKIVTIVTRIDIKSHSESQRDDGLTPVYIPKLAEKAGMSTDTVGKSLQKLAETGGMERKVEIVSDGKKDINKHVFIGLSEQLLKNPASLELPEKRNHGGKRVFCKGCGSTNINVRTTVICRDCGCTECVSEKILTGEEPLEDLPYMDMDVQASEEEVEPSTPQFIPIVQPYPPLLCHGCHNTDTRLWGFNSMRNKWECSTCHNLAYGSMQA